MNKPPFLNAIEQQYKERKLYKGFNLYLTDISLKPSLNIRYLFRTVKFYNELIINSVSTAIMNNCL